MNAAIETRCSFLSEQINPHFRISAYPLRVLVVDDDPDTRDVLQITLECLGYGVLTARDGEAGLRTAEREHPDVVISDIGMPGLDGYALMAQIRANPELESIPGIALTGYGLQSDIRRAFAAGFDAHMIKPADIDRLSRLLDNFGAHGRPKHNAPS